MPDLVARAEQDFHNPLVRAEHHLEKTEPVPTKTFNAAPFQHCTAISWQDREIHVVPQWHPTLKGLVMATWASMLELESLQYEWICRDTTQTPNCRNAETLKLESKGWCSNQPIDTLQRILCAQTVDMGHCRNCTAVANMILVQVTQSKSGLGWSYKWTCNKCNHSNPRNLIPAIQLDLMQLFDGRDCSQVVVGNSMMMSPTQQASSTPAVLPKPALVAAQPAPTLCRDSAAAATATATATTTPIPDSPTDNPFRDRLTFRPRVQTPESPNHDRDRKSDQNWGYRRSQSRSRSLSRGGNEINRDKQQDSDDAGSEHDNEIDNLYDDPEMEDDNDGYSTDKEYQTYRSRFKRDYDSYQSTNKTSPFFSDRNHRSSVMGRISNPTAFQASSTNTFKTPIVSSSSSESGSGSGSGLSSTSGSGSGSRFGKGNVEDVKSGTNNTTTQPGNNTAHKNGQENVAMQPCPYPAANFH